MRWYTTIMPLRPAVFALALALSSPTVAEDQPAQLYFYRENHLIGSAGRAEVFMDSKFIFEPGRIYYMKITTNKGSLGSWAGMPEWKATLEPDGAKKVPQMKNNAD